MNAGNVQQAFQEKVCAQVSLYAQGQDRYIVENPFMFDDGDHLVILLKREGENWLLTDEGHTFMHLSYDMDVDDLKRGARQKIVANALATFGATDRDGEIVVPVANGQYGDALYSMVQALLRITDVTFLNREQVRSTFLEDFKRLIADSVPQPRRAFDWHDAQHDPKASYVVDCRINGMARPLMVFALANETRAQTATISLLQFEQWGVQHQSLAVFEDQESINRKVLARFTDVCERQFSSLEGNASRIQNALQQAMGASA